MQIIFLIICIVAFVNSKLKVMRPQDLVDRIGSKVDMALANFGQIPFGHRLMGYVDMAYPYDGCSAFQPTYGGQFVLIERGNCSFVTKVKNAQNAGYQLAIIGNNNYEPLESDFVMADDGHGYSVNIPSIFITLRDFNIMKEYASRFKVNDSSDDKVFILVKFDVEKKDKIDVVLSLDVMDRDSYRVIDEFSQYYNLLKNENLNYTLIYQVFNANETQTEYLIDVDNCICSRRYCAIDPDGDGIASGRNVVEEAIRQTCIFKHYPVKFFEYMNQFNFLCTKAQAYSTCGNKIIQQFVQDFRDFLFDYLFILLQMYQMFIKIIYIIKISLPKQIELYQICKYQQMKLINVEMSLLKMFLIIKQLKIYQMLIMLFWNTNQHQERRQEWWECHQQLQILLYTKDNQQVREFLVKFAIVLLLHLQFVKMKQIIIIKLKAMVIIIQFWSYLLFQYQQQYSSLFYIFCLRNLLKETVLKQHKFKLMKWSVNILNFMKVKINKNKILFEILNVIIDEQSKFYTHQNKYINIIMIFQLSIYNLLYQHYKSFFIDYDQ